MDKKKILKSLTICALCIGFSVGPMTTEAQAFIKIPNPVKVVTQKVNTAVSTVVSTVKSAVSTVKSAVSLPGPIVVLAPASLRKC